MRTAIQLLLIFLLVIGLSSMAKAKKTKKNPTCPRPSEIICTPSECYLKHFMWKNHDEILLKGWQLRFDGAKLRANNLEQASVQCVYTYKEKSLYVVMTSDSTFNFDKNYDRLSRFWHFNESNEAKYTYIAKCIAKRHSVYDCPLGPSKKALIKF